MAWIVIQFRDLKFHMPKVGEAAECLEAGQRKKRLERSGFVERRVPNLGARAGLGGKSQSRRPTPAPALWFRTTEVSEATTETTSHPFECMISCHYLSDLVIYWNRLIISRMHLMQIEDIWGNTVYTNTSHEQALPLSLRHRKSRTGSTRAA